MNPRIVIVAILIVLAAVILVATACGDAGHLERSPPQDARCRGEACTKPVPAPITETDKGTPCKHC